MFQAASEGGQAGGGATAFFLIVLAIWALSRLDGGSAGRAKRAKRKREIDAIVRSRPEDADIFHEVLDELRHEGPKHKRP
ncbi:hypothetical protein [Streptomyces phaeochromogenes]|uniref:hypothetical protein n=1 Tax=Streptomyces phaeochromogenes TaxID=1923 RepID=UPI003866507D|nr:hypothetical protein OG277_08580 [Streptomyces phaeochromogenes]